MKNRYLTGLIPKDKKILPNIFKGSKSVKRIKPFAIKDVFIPSLAAALAILYSNNTISTILLFAPFVLIIPLAVRWIENRLSVNVTGTVKIVFSIMLIMLSVPPGMVAEQIAKESAAKRLLAEQEEEKQLAIARANEKIRLDSLSHYMDLVAAPRKDIDESLLFADKALAYVNSGDERSKLQTLTNSLKSQKVDVSIKKGNYKNAITVLNDLITSGNKNEGNYYRRAICFQKINQNQNAVNDLKMAISIGSPSAERMYNRINPLKRRVIYYVTRCCDGTTSNAKGRGACSWHGGVCNWNEPVYQEYRQYE